MQGLKALVIFMGVLIVAGTTALAILMVKKFNRMGEEETPAVVMQEAGDIPTPSVQVSGPGGHFGDVTEKLPAGSRVLSTHVSGALLLVRYQSADGEAILVFDMEAGKKRGVLTLQAQP
ncbi:hypothetical protein [Aestuariispira insulae]|uniref:Uncharacterized protein n=1 Tax=Aestuariispira insulae TaxID=1461337 RepID=A0A3D9HW42_9PROT|nr:hypothetical protein [Aestuariispira insulae]RED53635.1 hypothetical protein DFP90_101427 [Aestuariispira insulae]